MQFYGFVIFYFATFTIIICVNAVSKYITLQFTIYVNQFTQPN